MIENTEAQDLIEHEHYIVKEFKRLVRNYVSGADTDAKVYRQALASIRDKAIENGTCRWCRHAEHLYTCPAGIAGSALVMSHDYFHGPSDDEPR